MPRRNAPCHHACEVSEGTDKVVLQRDLHPIQPTALLSKFGRECHSPSRHQSPSDRHLSGGKNADCVIVFAWSPNGSSRGNIPCRYLCGRLRDRRDSRARLPIDRMAQNSATRNKPEYHAHHNIDARLFPVARSGRALPSRYGEYEFRISRAFSVSHRSDLHFDIRSFEKCPSVGRHLRPLSLFRTCSETATWPALAGCFQPVAARSNRRTAARSSQSIEDF